MSFDSDDVDNYIRVIENPKLALRLFKHARESETKDIEKPVKIDTKHKA